MRGGDYEDELEADVEVEVDEGELIAEALKAQELAASQAVAIGREIGPDVLFTPVGVATVRPGASLYADPLSCQRLSSTYKNGPGQPHHLSIRKRII